MSQLFILRLLCYLLPVAAFLTLWFPFFAHYYVSDVTLSYKTVNEARKLAPDSILKELKTMSLFLAEQKTSKDVAQSAAKLLKGETQIVGKPPMKVGSPLFEPSDLTDGPLAQKLGIAVLMIPDLLIDAYELTNHDEFLVAARNYIVKFALYEKSNWLPKGLLWNDHAIAERIFVLTKFWYHYRKHTLYNQEIAHHILQLVSRSGQFLAKDSHFTFETNHGILQNLALWHLSIAFPTIPNTEGYKKTARKRMTEQMAYYINENGVILEHSAGYHKVGLRLIGMAMRYLTLLNENLPTEWILKYEKAKNVYKQLRRFDGTLPIFGDSATGLPDELGPLVSNIDQQKRMGSLRHKKVWGAPQPYNLFPVAGYAVWWDGLRHWPKVKKTNQTVLIWSHFPGHAHKHADEMSIIMWAGGQRWWTNIGYWPFGDPGRLKALSWDGSNAPHSLNETASSRRTTKILNHARSDSITFIDLERTNSDGYSARRQVVYVVPSLWFILDNVSGNTGSRTVWNTASNIHLIENRGSGAVKSYTLHSRKTDANLETFFWGSAGSKITTVQGGMEPFAGWEVLAFRPTPTSAVVVEQPPKEAWSAAAWAWHSNETEGSIQFHTAPSMKDWNGAEKWEVDLPIKSGGMTIARKGKQIVLQDFHDKTKIHTLKLSPPPNIRENVANIHRSFSKTASKHQKFKDFYGYRLRFSWILCALLILQEVLFFAVKKSQKTQRANILALIALTWTVTVALTTFFNQILEFSKNVAEGLN